MENLIRKMKRLGLKLGIMKGIGYEAEFTCAFRKKEDKEGFIAYEELEDYWYADPLIFQYKNEEYVFMEAFERSTGLGRIAVSQVGEEGWKPPEIILKENFHLSFPMIFEHRGILYMIPETSTADKVILYECKEFPMKWEKRAEFFQGRKLVDIVPVRKEESTVTFLASECEKDSLRVRFQAFTINFDSNCAVELKEYNCCQEYNFISRNGGVMVNGQLVLQKSTQAVYGYSILFAKSDEVLPCNVDIIREIKPADIKLYNNKIKHIIGTHTYSCSEKYELVDIQYMRFNKTKWINRYCERRKNGK